MAAGGESALDVELVGSDGKGGGFSDPSKIVLPMPPVPGKARSGGGGHGGAHGGDHGGGGYETPHGGLLWLVVCFVGIMGSFILYGIVMEYATSGGRKLHELSLIFVTSLLYSVTAYVGRWVRGEEPTTIPKSQMIVLGFTSMGSTFTSVRSLRYVIYPVQVLAKSCKPIPVMLMGAFMGKKYPAKKYVNVVMIVAGVALFMKSGNGSGKANAEPGGQVLGLLLLFISLCFDGGTGAYEDKLMCKHHVGPFDLMFNIQFAKMLLAGIGLVVSGEINYFFRTVNETGLELVLLGLTGACGQVFIFVTISKFGALTCSIIGLARKIVTLLASILIYGHAVNGVQGFGLALAVSAMVINFLDRGKKKGKGGGHGGHGGGGHGNAPAKSVAPADKQEAMPDELKSLIANENAVDEEEEELGQAGSGRGADSGGGGARDVERGAGGTSRRA